MKMRIIQKIRLAIKKFKKKNEFSKENSNINIIY